MMRTSAPIRGLSGALACVLPALWVMWPLLPSTTAVPGAGDGDNLAALWNAWWFAEGRPHAGWPFWTPLLFAPFGTQLSLHTHATTHSFLAWLWTTVSPLTGAHNLAIAAGLGLNGACTFLLAFRLTGRVLPAIAAGIAFVSSTATGSNPGSCRAA